MIPKGRVTTAEVLAGPCVQIVRPNGEILVLTNAEVCIAASIMRDEMLRCLPVEVPTEFRKCQHLSVVNTSAGKFCEDCGAEL